MASRSVAAVVATAVMALLSEQALSTTLQVTCTNARGSRVQYVDNPAAPPTQNRRFVVADDAISGVRVQLTFSTESRDSTMVMSGNVNTGGRVTSVRLVRMQSAEYYSFVGIDEDDGATYLLSYFPANRRLVWTSHIDRIFMITGVALAKSFMMDCTVRSL